MTAPKTTLARRLTVQTDDGVGMRHDVLLTIHDNPRGITNVVISTPGILIDLSLSGAERISLIEALGGTVGAVMP